MTKSRSFFPNFDHDYFPFYKLFSNLNFWRWLYICITVKFSNFIKDLHFVLAVMESLTWKKKYLKGLYLDLEQNLWFQWILKLKNNLDWTANITMVKVGKKLLDLVIFAPYLFFFYEFGYSNMYYSYRFKILFLTHYHQYIFMISRIKLFL